MLCIPLTSISIIWIASIVLLLDLIIVPVAIALVGATSDETIEVVDSFAWTYSWWSYAAIPLLVILFPHAGRVGISLVASCWVDWDGEKVACFNFSMYARTRRRF